jgi:hypothetical protein
VSQVGLPDGIFSYKKFRFGHIFEDLGMENVGTFYGHFEYFTAFWCFLKSFAIFYGHLVYFPRFGMVYGEKSGTPGMYPSNKVRHVNTTTRWGTSPIKSFALQTYIRPQAEPSIF